MDIHGHKTIGLKRLATDKFFTKLSTVQICMDKITDVLLIDKNNDIVVEPCAGNGSFIPSIKNICNNYVFYDIEPEHDDIIKKDFLDVRRSSFNSQYSKIHIVGNPPFGRQSSLLFKFIMTACMFCDTFSFILPRSFKKQSVQKRVPKRFHLIAEIDLPDNSFTINDRDHNVPCIFQIWEKQRYERKIHPRTKPIHFKFVNSEEIADVSFRRIGVNAGYVDTNTYGKNHQSHYFIRFKDRSIISDNETINKLKSIEFKNKRFTVGPNSISKQDVIHEFDKVLSTKNTCV